MNTFLIVQWTAVIAAVGCAYWAFRTDNTGWLWAAGFIFVCALINGMGQKEREHRESVLFAIDQCGGGDRDSCEYLRDDADPVEDDREYGRYGM